jgi:hypothetical protein
MLERFACIAMLCLVTYVTCCYATLAMPPQAPPPTISNQQLEAFMDKQKAEITEFAKDLTAKQCEALETHLIHGYPDALPVFNK